MTAAQALALAVQRLKVADVPDAANDARILLAHALGVERGRLTLVLPDEISAQNVARLDAAVAKRAKRQPVSHIIGAREFYGRSFLVTPDVLDPRPETELLVQAALTSPFETVLDIGVGSGCILLTLLSETVSPIGQGADISAAALVVARQNAALLNLDKRCRFITSDWFTEIKGRFDLIVANPPYIAAHEMADLSPEVRNWEPEIALTPGGDGLNAYRIVTATAQEYLTPKGRLIVEIGPTQAEPVCTLFEAAGFEGITTLQDMDGRDRVVLGTGP